MHLSLTDEQRFLIDAAQDALSRHPTLESARGALDGTPAPELWSLATDAGWAGLLIGDDAEGAQLSVYDALLILEVSGRRLADARLLGHLPATALLEEAGVHRALRAALADGTLRGALVGRAAGDRGRAVTVAGGGDELRLTGSVHAVLDAAGADVLVVIGQDAAGEAVAAAVDARADGLSVQRQPVYDATRSLAEVHLDAVPGTALALDPARVRDGFDLQRLLLAAESVGAADACLTMARDYAVDRVAFGRPIGSYQAIKHKLVEMLRKIEGARSLLVAAGRAWDEDRASFALLANAARVAGADALGYAAPENIFIHGGVGATWEHDASLYYRRGEHARRIAGGTDAAADDVAGALLDDHVAVAV